MNFKNDIVLKKNKNKFYNNQCSYLILRFYALQISCIFSDIFCLAIGFGELLRISVENSSIFKIFSSNYKSGS